MCMLCVSGAASRDGRQQKIADQTTAELSVQSARSSFSKKCNAPEVTKDSLTRLHPPEH